jgi:hypothetical protein
MYHPSHRLYSSIIVLTIISFKSPCSTAIAKKRGSQLKYFTDPRNYDRFYNWVWQVSLCWEVDLCALLPGMIVDKLKQLGEIRAADWFGKTWCVDAYWMLGYVPVGGVLHNNSIEGSWRWLKESAKVYGHRSTVQVFTLMLFRYITDQSEKQQHELIRLRHPNTFPRTPEISKEIWIALQKMPVRCIEMFRVVTRKGIENSDFTAGQADFEPYMRAVMQAEGDKLYHKILNADHPPDTGILMANFPTHLTIRPGRQELHLEYCDLFNNGPGEKDIVQTLQILKAYHVVKRLETPWSKEIAYSCTCLTFFKHGACEHSIIVTMILDKRSVQIPSKYRIDRPSAVPSKKIGLENFEYAGKSSSSEQDDFEEPAPPPLPAKKSIPVGGRQKRKVKPDDYV